MVTELIENFKITKVDLPKQKCVRLVLTELTCKLQADERLKLFLYVNTDQVLLRRKMLQRQQRL